MVHAGAYGGWLAAVGDQVEAVGAACLRVKVCYEADIAILANKAPACRDRMFHKPGKPTLGTVYIGSDEDLSRAVCRPAAHYPPSPKPCAILA